MDDSIKIVHIDRAPVVRAGLRAIVEGHNTLRVVAETDSSRQGMEIADQVGAKMLVTDLDVPDEQSFLDNLRDLRMRPRGVAVVVFTRRCEPSTFGRIVSAEVDGFVTHYAAPSDVVDVLETVAGGERTLIPPPLLTAPTPKSAPVPVADVARLLSQREIDIVRFLASGLSVKQVALALQRSPKTVDAQKTKIMRKLHVHDRVGITRWAIREGLVEP